MHNNDTQHKGQIYDTQHKNTTTLVSLFMLSVVALSEVDINKVGMGQKLPYFK
jgi:hypothetical protein